MPTHRRTRAARARAGKDRYFVGLRAQRRERKGNCCVHHGAGDFCGGYRDLSYGIGEVINAPHEGRADGPNSKWTKTVDIRQLGNLPSNPEMQNKVAELTQTFPTPRVQVDNGDQDIADLHAREDLLLNNYTWIDQSKGQGEDPDRARHGIGRSARLAGGGARANTTADDRRQ